MNAAMDLIHQMRQYYSDSDLKANLNRRLIKLSKMQEALAMESSQDPIQNLLAAELWLEGLRRPYRAFQGLRRGLWSSIEAFMGPRGSPVKLFGALEGPGTSFGPEARAQGALPACGPYRSPARPCRASYGPAGRGWSPQGAF